MIAPSLVQFRFCAIKDLQHIMVVKISIHTTVNVLGQYVLSNPYVVVHLFSKCALRAAFAAPCVLAEQVYHYIRVAKNILP